MDRVSALKARYAFDAWGGRTTLPENLFVWRYALGAGDLPGWSLQRLQRFEEPAGGVEPAAEHAPPGLVQARTLRSADLPAEVHEVRPLPAPGRGVARGAARAPVPHLTHTRSFWRPPGASEEVLLNTEIFEAPSREAAHELLMTVLTTVQSPLVRRREDAGFGDVVFTGPGDSFVLFARANLVIMIRNAGAKLVPVVPLAAELDARVISKPAPGPEAGAGGVRAFKVAAPAQRVRVGAAVHIRPPLAAGPGAAPKSVRLFTRAAEIRRDASGEVVFRPAQPGHQRIEVYTDYTDAPTTSDEIGLDVEEQ